MDKESSSSSKTPINSPTKSEDIWLQPNQPLKNDHHPENNRMLIDFEISVIGEEEEAEEVLSSESGVVSDSAASPEKKWINKNSSKEREMVRKWANIKRDNSKKMFKKVTINLEELEESSANKKSEVARSLKVHNSPPSSPVDAPSSQPGIFKKGTAFIAKLWDTNVLDGDSPRPPQPSTSCFDLSQPPQKPSQIDVILSKHFDENIAIEDQNNSEKTENAHIVTSKTDSTNTGEDEKKEVLPALDHVFWNKFGESEDPAWKAVMDKVRSLLNSANTFEMKKLYIEYLKLIEQLSYSLNSYKQIVTYAVQVQNDTLLCEDPKRLEHVFLSKQFNLHFPSLLLTILNARESCQVNTLYALYDLVDHILLNTEAVQNVIIGLFDFLSVSEEMVKQYHKAELSEDGSNDGDAVLQYPIYLNANWNSSKCRIDLVTLLAPTAKLLGTERSEELLLPAFQRYMSDSSDVQNAVLAHLFCFCEVLSPKSREIVLRDLSQLFSLDMDARCWRQRAEFASQLNQLIDLLPIELVNKYLCAYALTFSADKISQVRTNGIRMLSTVLSMFIENEWKEQKDLWRRRTEHLSDAIPVTSSDSSMLADEEPIDLPLTFELLAEIRSGFWRTRSWRRRQSFAHLLHLLVQYLLTPLQFYYLFFHDFMCLSDDNVANVRQYFCLIAQFNRFEEYVGVSVIKRLEQMSVDDDDLEVRHLSKKQPLDEEFIKHLINDEKVPAYARAIIELLANDISLLTTEKLAILKAIGRDRYKQLVGRGGLIF
uniref:UPF0518 protein n=1 Tax=Meloidogyne hapla TaxID=6305 RepID=A0A1I8B8N9_MELHA